MLTDRRKNNLEIGNRIREIRNCMDYTQTNMADEMGISLSAYKKIESGTMMVTIQLLKFYKENYGISSDFILFGKLKNMRNIDRIIENMAEEEREQIYVELLDYFVNQKKKAYIRK